MVLRPRQPAGGAGSAVELKRLATFDELRPDDLVWREGMTEWAAARNVRGLFEDDGGAAVAAAAGVGLPRRPARRPPSRRSRCGRCAHPFDTMMEKSRPHFNAHFIETDCGHLSRVRRVWPALGGAF